MYFTQKRQESVKPFLTELDELDYSVNHLCVLRGLYIMFFLLLCQALV